MVHVWRTFVLFTTCPTITKEGEPGSYLNTRIAVFAVGVKQTDPRVRDYGRPPYVGGTVTCHVAAALNTSPTHRKVTGQDAQLGHYSVGIWYSPRFLVVAKNQGGTSLKFGDCWAGTPNGCMPIVGALTCIRRADDSC